MFKINNSKTYKFPVKYYYHDDDGDYTEMNFSVDLLRMSQKEYQDTDFNKPVIEILNKVLKGWYDIIDENDNPIPFNTKELKKISDNYSGFAETIFLAFVNSYKDQLAKNLGKLAEDGE